MKLKNIFVAVIIGCLLCCYSTVQFKQNMMLATPQMISAELDLGLGKPKVKK